MKNLLKLLKRPKIYQSEADIKLWLNKRNIKNYKLIPDAKYGFIVDVAGSVDLSTSYIDFPIFKKISRIPVKFNRVEDDFLIMRNNLISLDNCPAYVGGNFYCSDNQVINLEGGPEFVGGTYSCFGNQITSLKGIAKKIGKSFDCSYNQLTSLLDSPRVVAGNYKCNDNQLLDLEHITIYIEGNFNCKNNRLEHLECLPGYVGGDIKLGCNEKLKKLQDITNFNELKSRVFIEKENEMLSGIVLPATAARVHKL